MKVKIGKYMPYYYAGASLDYNLIHIDREFAQANGLPDIILPVSYTHLTLPTKA